MRIVTITLAFPDESDAVVKDWLNDMQCDVECMDEAPQFLTATWAPGVVYSFTPYPGRHAPLLVAGEDNQ